MWCMHSIFNVKSVFLGSTAATCKNMLRSSMDAFSQVRGTGIMQHTSRINPLTLLNIGVNTQSNFVLKMCPNYPLEASECSLKS